MIRNLKNMKRILALLVLALLAVACTKDTRVPVITGYRLSQIGSPGFGPEGVTADVTLEIDVQNSSADRFTVESLEAILYRGTETSPFANLVLQESAFIEPKSEANLPLPLKARFTRPLALLGGGFSTDLSTYTADLDLTVRKGSYKKRITQERVPLDQLGSLLGQTAKTKAYEKE